MKNNKFKSKKTSLLIGSFIIFLIVITPYLLYFYTFLDEKNTEEIHTFLGTLKKGIYPSVQYYVYFFSAKFVPLLLLIIWFITNKHWWVHALIIPISVYLFQLIAVINDSEAFIDEVEFIYSVPITAIVLVILYFVRSKMAIYIQAIDLKKEMDQNMKNPKKID